MKLDQLVPLVALGLLETQALLVMDLLERLDLLVTLGLLVLTLQSLGLLERLDLLETQALLVLTLQSLGLLAQQEKLVLTHRLHFSGQMVAPLPWRIIKSSLPIMQILEAQLISILRIPPLVA